MLVPAAAEAGLGTLMPEAAVLVLPTEASDRGWDVIGEELESADTVLVGPGFDDAGETRATLLSIAKWRIRWRVHAPKSSSSGRQIAIDDI